MKTTAKHTNLSSASVPSNSKRRLFFLITIAFPFLALFILEIGLRLFHYDDNLELVIQKEVNGKKVYGINRAVARRYFAYSGTVIPEPADDTFTIEKPKNTKRIFCLGESTMAGFPYDFNATAPSFLKDRLQAEFPKYNFEVINVGLSAISSYVVADFMKDLIDYDPDLFIIYLGHNEFYGIYGSGSSVQVPGGYWITRLAVSLLRFKTYLLLRDCYAWTKQKLSTSSGLIKGTLMEQMVGNQYILYRSPEYEATRENFARNIGRIIDIAESKEIPIIFSSLVSNLKDDPPFHGMFSPSTTSESKALWKTTLQRGDSLFHLREYRSADSSYKACTLLDSLNATAYFRLGQCQYSLGEYHDALRTFVAAKDFDGLRFRASEEFEHTLESTCAQRGAIIAATDSAFAANSEHGIVGNKLILEHLHPNIDGYFLMGKVFARTIRDHHLLFPDSTWDSSKIVSDEQCESISGVTEFDKVVGSIKVAYLTHEWPFVENSEAFSYSPKNGLDSIALNYVLEKTIWSTSRYDLATYDALHLNYVGARAECYAISKVIPFSYQPLLRIADFYAFEGNRDSAALAYKSCYEREDNPYARIKLAVVLLQEDRPAEAVEQLQTAIGLTMRKGFALTNKEQAFSYYLLGVANAKLGKLDLAREFAAQALSVDPALSEAKGLLSQLDSIHKR